jgi:hypothetical protein
MKIIRKWARILHRDIGYFFVGASLIYGFSGIALNHLSDWNPNYSVDYKVYETNYDFSDKELIEQKIQAFLADIHLTDDYKTYAYVNDKRLKIYLKGGSTVAINLDNNTAEVELLQKRFFFYQANYLHYNPNKWWTWFSDIFAGSLILFALTALVMVKGKKGTWGRGGIYVLLGILIPIAMLLWL